MQFFNSTEKFDSVQMNLFRALDSKTKAYFLPNKDFSDGNWCSTFVDIDSEEFSENRRRKLYHKK